MLMSDEQSAMYVVNVEMEINSILVTRFSQFSYSPICCS